jgi:hypothetical protein
MNEPYEIHLKTATQLIGGSGQAWMSQDPASLQAGSLKLVPKLVQAGT